MQYDLDKISQLLTASPDFTRSGLVYFQEIDSTNSWLLAQDNVHGKICLAENQTAGRGRRHKPWVGESGGSLLISMGWRLDRPYVPGLSLVSGLAVCCALEDVGIANIKLKWPNDIILRGKKLGGILVESSAGNYVIGIGLNINLTSGVAIDQPWTDFASEGLECDANHLVAALVNHHHSMIMDLLRQGFNPFVSRWSERDVLADRSVEITTATGKQQGIAKGVNDRGELLVQSTDKMLTFSSGVESVRLLDVISGNRT